MKKKNVFLLLSLAFCMISFYGCEEKDEPILSAKLNFVDLRQAVKQAPLTVIDDSVSMITAVKFKNQTIFSAKWKNGIYSGPIIKTRLLWANSKDNLNFLIIGFDDLFYEQLLVIKANSIVSSYEIGIINLLESELKENETKIWFKYNNSWTRTGPILDSEMQISLK